MGIRYTSCDAGIGKKTRQHPFSGVSQGMKRALLESLKGLSQKEAEAAVISAGHEAIVVENGVAISLMAMPGSVVLWLDTNDLVSEASAGDPCDLED